jgi:hypothetical protein
MYDMYKQKKKRTVDPNAPPRPNLLNHEKRLKDVVLTAQQQSDLVLQLRNRIDELERKQRAQTQYLSTLHNTISRLTKNG